MLVNFQRNVQCIRTLRCAHHFVIVVFVVVVISIIVLSYFNTRFSPSAIPKYQVCSCFLRSFHVTLSLVRIPLTIIVVINHPFSQT